MLTKADRSSYTALDFRQWHEAKALVLTPKFQRRNVWTTPQRSYLIDTILRGLPIPPIYLRIRQSDDRKRTIREVIDGQQRITSILEFINGVYKLSRTLDAPYAGKSFDQLGRTTQDSLVGYAFICESFTGIEDSEILEIFARLNTYSVPLNGQELRNGKFFGLFKQSVYALAHEHLEFWRTNKILAEQPIARMADAELVGELLATQIRGMGDKKRALDPIYVEFDEHFPTRKDEEKRFRATIDVISDVMGAELKDTEFHRRALFYSLYCAVFHRLYGLPQIKLATPANGKLTKDDREELRNTVLKLSAVLEGDTATAPYTKFITASQRQTDNVQPRTVRMTTIYSEAFG
ncbi:MAG: DUF262 domain-containing protein [Kofleriaceae bacterium]